MPRPSYQTSDPKGWGGDPRRGAALGRPEIMGAYDGSKLTLRCVPLYGDYDCNGTYFGNNGVPLYWCADDSGRIDFVLRAVNRQVAKAIVREMISEARFWR